MLQLDDFITVLRHTQNDRGSFGCAIKPRQENLAAAKAFVESWKGKAVAPRRRDRWVADLRTASANRTLKSGESTAEQMRPAF